MIPWLRLFGPSDLAVKGVVAMIGCLHLVVVYRVTGFAGRAPRYVLLFYPFLQMLFAWALLRLGRARRLWGVILVILVMTPQVWALSRLAGERTVNEWNISLHGEDVKKVARFLEERNLTAVVAPNTVRHCNCSIRQMQYASGRRG